MGMYKLLFSLLLVFTLIGCSANKEGSDDSDDKSVSVEDSTLNVAYMAQPPMLDPHVTNAVATRDISRNVFEQLLSFNENNEVAPLLAESFEQSEDGKTITFKLRKGVKFHNGKEMTADDVVASMERWKRVNGKANAYFSKSEFVKEDDYTVLLNMDQPLTIAKYLIAMNGNIAAIMPKEIIEAAEDSGVKEYIGTGPFSFVEWKQDQYIYLEKNKDYQSASTAADGLVGKREPLVDNLYFHFVLDSSTRTSGIQTGDYDVALAIPSDNVPLLKEDSNLDIHVKHGGFTTVVFNKRNGLFANIKAREAVNLAVKKEDVMISAFTNEDYFTLEHGLLGEAFTTWHNDAGKDVYEEYNPEKAKQLLKEAGYNGEPIRLITTRDYEDQYYASVVIQQQLEEIGVSVDLQVYDWPTLMDKQNDDTAFELLTMGYAPPTDPTEVNYLSSKNNYSGWSNSPELDKLLEDMMVASDDEAMKEIFTMLQEETWNYLPAIKFGDFNRVTVTHGEINDFKFFHGPILWNVSKGN